MIRISSIVLAAAFWTGVANAAPGANSAANDLLVQFVDANALHSYEQTARLDGAKIEDLGGGNWVRMQFKNHSFREANFQSLLADARVAYVQPNYKIRLMEDYRAKDSALRARVNKDRAARNNGNASLLGHPYPDNPPFAAKGPPTVGPDPKVASQWGMLDIGVTNAWKQTRGEGLVVAVIDSGIDYTHEDLIDNLWHNPGEMGTDANGKDKSTNGIDDDGNGYIDDVIGWDFVSNDNKPYDLAVDPLDLLGGGGNPGHGTHCAGNVAAVADNATGIAGVAPGAKIMGLRFISDKGSGDTAGAVKAINYAVKMGAKILSNSWGSEGEDPKEEASNKALRDSIKNAMAQGALFIAAAGNGHQGVGYDNDTDAKPAYPASYDIENIVSVAALDKQDNLGAFSNWGKKTVHIGAPGVVVFSTTVGSKYSDVVLDLPQYGIYVTWDGTSMAAPHVAGAAALWWAKHPTATWRDVKSALLSSVKPVSALNNKCVSGGKLNVEKLLMQ